MDQQKTKRPRGRPPTNLGRKPRNIQMSDEHYEFLCELGGSGRAAEGLAVAVERIKGLKKRPSP